MSILTASEKKFFTQQQIRHPFRDLIDAHRRAHPPPSSSTSTPFPSNPSDLLPPELANQTSDRLSLATLLSLLPDHTFRTHILPLSPRIAAALLDLCRAVQSAPLSQQSPYSIVCGRVDADLALQELECVLDDAISSHFEGRRVFAKLADASPKDTIGTDPDLFPPSDDSDESNDPLPPFIPLYRKLLATTQQALLPLRCASAALHALIRTKAHYLGHASALRLLSALAQSPSVLDELVRKIDLVFQSHPVHIALRAWEDVDPAFEFRLFVVRNVPVACCQLPSLAIGPPAYPQLFPLRQTLRDSLQAFFDETLRENLALLHPELEGSLACDLYYDQQRERWLVVDLNPLEGHLLGHDDVLHQHHGHQRPLELRLVEKTDPNILTEHAFPMFWLSLLTESQDSWFPRLHVDDTKIITCSPPFLDDPLLSSSSTTHITPNFPVSFSLCILSEPPLNIPSLTELRRPLYAAQSSSSSTISVTIHFPEILQSSSIVDLVTLMVFLEDYLLLKEFESQMIDPRHLPRWDHSRVQSILDGNDVPQSLEALEGYTQPMRIAFHRASSVAHCHGLRITQADLLVREYFVLLGHCASFLSQLGSSSPQNFPHDHSPISLTSARQWVTSERRFPLDPVGAFASVGIDAFALHTTLQSWMEQSGKPVESESQSNELDSNFKELDAKLKELFDFDDEDDLDDQKDFDDDEEDFEDDQNIVDSHLETRIGQNLCFLLLNKWHLDLNLHEQITRDQHQIIRSIQNLASHSIDSIQVNASLFRMSIEELVLKLFEFYQKLFL